MENFKLSYRDPGLVQGNEGTSALYGKPALGTANEVLIGLGLLSNAKCAPSWAISLNLLEEFHTKRLETRGRFSIGSFFVPLYDKLGLSRNNSDSDKFRQAYAVYVGILRRLEEQQKIAVET